MRPEQSKLVEWVAGFYDGEGCVETHISKHDGSAVGYGFNPQTRISQSYIGGLFDAEGNVCFSVSEADDHNVGFSTGTSARVGHRENSPLLDRLESFADQIDVDYNVHFKERDKDQWADVFHWSIHKRDDLETFLREVRPHCVVKSSEIDILLEEIYPRLNAGYAGNRRGFLELIAWRDVMDAHKGGLRGKYNLNYFEELWDMSLENDRLPDAHPRKKGTLVADVRREGDD